MQILKKFVASFVLLSSILFTGCQENSIGGIATAEDLEAASSSGISVYLPVNTDTLTSNSEIVTIDVSVFDDTNNPYTKGNVNIVYPADVKTGRDIGSFESSSVALDKSGKAQFRYTAPSNLKANTADIAFKFYYETNSTVSKTYTFSLQPDSDQVTLTTYSLNSSLSDSDVTMHLESSKQISFNVKDAQGNLVLAKNMNSIKVTLLNTKLAILNDSTGTKATQITVTKKDTITVSLESFKISGIVPLEVTASFTDVNGKTQTLTKVYNMIILSGPPTAISLSYNSTEKSNNAKFIEKWVVSVTDKYNNPVNTNPAVSMGMMAGYAQSSAPTSNDANYLYYRTFEGNATLNGVERSLSVNSSLGSSNVFANVQQANDYLVTFGNGYTYNASGKWTINTNDDASILDLVDDYNGAVTKDLGFAVGNNFRQDACRDSVEWIGNVYPENDNYTLDSTGSMRLNVEYDYYLTGKDVILWVNLVGKQNIEDTTTRLGEAKKVTLRAKGLDSETFTFARGYDGYIRFYPRISETGEWLKNANFGYSMNVKSEGVVSVKRVDSSMQPENSIKYCYGANKQNGTSFVEVHVVADPDSNSSGTLTFENVVIGSEF